MAAIQDKARIQADKILGQTEKTMGRIYNEDPALVKIQKRLVKYLDGVKKDTQTLYDAYKADGTKEAKQAYENAVRKATLGSKEYNAIIKEFTRVLAQVNQKALDVVNGTLPEVYAVSYNNVADECRRVGMRVNGRG